jgi:hypothetical protein
MPHLSSTIPSRTSKSLICVQCALRRRIAFPRRQSAFLAIQRTGKRNLSAMAGTNIDSLSTPTWLSSSGSVVPLPRQGSPINDITQDLLDRLYTPFPLERPSPGLIAPQINTSDPEGIQQFLIQGTSLPKNTVELLTLLDALVAQEDLVRAAKVVVSLNRQLNMATPLATLVYNKYLQGVVSTILAKNAGLGKAMDWYEQMVQVGVTPDRTTFALLAQAAYSLVSVTDGNRAAKKVFQLWLGQGGDMGELLSDILFPQKEIVRSLKVLFVVVGVN